MPKITLHGGPTNMYEDLEPGAGLEPSPPDVEEKPDHPGPVPPQDDGGRHKAPEETTPADDAETAPKKTGGGKK